MRYVTINELSNIVRNNIFKVPHDIDLVVGVPRSGLLPANMIALYLNTQLSDVDSFINGHIYKSGRRGEYIANLNFRKILVVDDSVCSGASISEAKAKLLAFNPTYEYIFCSPIVTTLGQQFVDIWFETIDDVRVFEWNLFHHHLLANACLDIDGVLNVDPSEDDDGGIYISFLNNAKPLFVPTVRISTLISCRLEKYRKETENWLRNHNVQYDRLVLLDFPNKDARVKWGKHGKYKGHYYKTSTCGLFIESNKNQAQEIANISSKPVICIETNSLVRPTESIVFKSKKKVKKYLPGIYSKLKKLKDRIFLL